jgi:hypothetical protein
LWTQAVDNGLEIAGKKMSEEGQLMKAAPLCFLRIHHSEFKRAKAVRDETGLRKSLGVFNDMGL